MSQEANGAEAPKPNDSHSRAPKEKSRRGNLEPQSRRSNKVRTPKNVKSRVREPKTTPANDLEFNLQDELVQGNFKARGRKTQISINHLLDFQLPERSTEVAPASGVAKRRARRSEEEHVYLHGESFINANFKFLVDDRFTYQEQTLDPNIPIPREKIVRVEVAKDQSCPICLTEDIVAPRMISCGHLFCYTCMLSFFANDDGDESSNKDRAVFMRKKSKRKECPLCSTFVREETAVPVKFAEAHEPVKLPQAGQVVRFELMCKPHGSMLALPVQLDIDPMSLNHFPSVELSELAPYTRIMKCSYKHAIDLFQKDLNDIQTQADLDRAIYNDDGKFATLAMNNISLRIKAYKETPSELQGDGQLHFLPVDLSKLSIQPLHEQYDDQNAFFFFQTGFEANTRYYLSPLDVKVLITAFGQYSKFPSVLFAQVEDVHYGAIVTESLLQKYKYFGHLPFGSEITFVDVDWRSVPDLPSDVYHRFAPELNSRRRKSASKKQREDKEKRRHEKRLERQQEEFYMRENGEAPSFVAAPSMPIPMQHGRVQQPAGQLVAQVSGGSDSHDPKDSQEGNSSSQVSRKVEKTIWGTSIPRSEQKSDEDLEFEKMLQNINEHKRSQTSGKKKKRGVTLMSSGNSRGTL
ncbi:LAFA_0G12684g1_1 [Lachancea sp. 'fantastica']|nr:LAFA_0G12684g1_1 [Lachancea sp. 'fantastica']